MIRILLSNILGARKMSQADLARVTGIRPNTINSMYHEYASRVSLEHLDVICKALDCSLDELIVMVPDDNVNHTKKPGNNNPGYCRSCRKNAATFDHNKE